MRYKLFSMSQSLRNRIKLKATKTKKKEHSLPKRRLMTSTNKLTNIYHLLTTPSYCYWFIFTSICLHTNNPKYMYNVVVDIYILCIFAPLNDKIELFYVRVSFIGFQIITLTSWTYLQRAILIPPTKQAHDNFHHFSFTAVR